MGIEVRPAKRHVSLEEGWANINALRAQNMPIERCKEYKLETRIVGMLELILEKKANEMTIDQMLAKYDAILM